MHRVAVRLPPGLHIHYDHHFSWFVAVDASAPPLPHLVFSLPCAQLLSTYPNVSLTLCTVSKSPVFFPTLSLILIAGLPFADESLITIFKGSDLVPLVRCVKSSMDVG